MTELQKQTKELKEKILNHRNYNDGNNKKNAFRLRKAFIIK